MNKHIISLLQGLYIAYMYNFFKTTKSIHHPFEYLVDGHNFIKHPVNTGLYENKICPIGNIVSFILLIWFIFRLSLIHI